MCARAAEDCCVLKHVFGGWNGYLCITAKDVASAESPEEAEPLVSIEDFVSCSG